MSWSWAGFVGFHILFLSVFGCSLQFFFQSMAWQVTLTSYYLDLSYSQAILKCFIDLNSSKILWFWDESIGEIYWKYRTAGHFVFWKPWPVTGHGVKNLLSWWNEQVLSISMRTERKEIKRCWKHLRVEHIIVASHHCKSFPHKTVPHAKIRKQMRLEHKEWWRLFYVKAT